MLEAIEVRTELAQDEEVATEIADAIMEAFRYTRVEVEMGPARIRVLDVDAPSSAFRAAHGYEAVYLRQIMQCVLARRAFEAGERRYEAEGVGA